MSADPPGSTPADAIAQLELGAVDQISFAVADIAASLPEYTAIFGEFTVRNSTLTPDNLTYRDKPSGVELRLAFCRSSGIEIELVQVLSGDWPTVDHLERHGSGVHHIRFRVDDLDSTLVRIYGAGFELVLRGSSPSGSEFAYLEAPSILGHTMVELLQPPPA